MKKTYLARRNALLTTRGISWSVGALLFSLVVLGVRIAAPNVFWHIFTPAFRASDAIASASGAFFSHFSDAAKLTALAEKLTAENMALSIENKALQQRVAAQEALAGSSSRARSGIVAGVVARPPVSPYDQLVLGKGSDDGVALGMEAFGPGNVPIGIVSSVVSDFSQVTLFSSPSVSTHGWVGEHSLPLTLVGSGGGAFSASAPRGALVSVGDVVSVPGPGQLPLGRVVRVDSDSLSPAVTLHIVSAANLFSLSVVELRATGFKGVTFATSTLP